MKYLKLIAQITLLILAGLSSVYASSVFVDGETLQKKLANKDLVIIDMSNERQYKRFHLPNALYISFGEMNERKKNGVSDSIGVERMIKLLSDKGLTANDDIVIYDDMAALHAARLYWELERLGHKKVAILDGGLVGWVLNNNKVSNAPVTRPKSIYKATKVSSNTLASLSDVIAASKGSKTLVIDVRSEGEYTGNPKKPRTGHIPGALWYPWNQSVNLDKGFNQKSPAEITKNLNSLGVTDKNAELIVLCQSGHRASQAYITLKDLGFNNVRLYDGSMSEYSKEKTAPLVKGSKAR